LLTGGEFAPEGRLDLVRDREHQVCPDGQAARRGEEVHSAEERFTDLFSKEIIQDPAHLPVQLTGDGEHFPVVRDFFTALADLFLEGVQFGEGTGEAFKKVHVGGVERDRHLPVEEVFLHAEVKIERFQWDLPFLWYTSNCIRTRDVVESVLQIIRKEVALMSKKSGIAALVIAIIALCLSVLNLTLAQKPAAQETRDIQYVMYVGTNDKDTNEPVCSLEEAKGRAADILVDHFGGYTIQEANGGWQDGDTMYQEDSLVIFLSDTTLDKVHAAADDLIQAFHQSTILIQANETTTEFYSSGS